MEQYKVNKDKDSVRVRFPNNKDAKITIVFDDKHVRDYGHHYYLDGFDDIVVSARIADLYKGDLARGHIRKILCSVLNQLVDEGTLASDSYMSLEASGDIDGSFAALINMYHRMSFKPVSTYLYEDDGTAYTPENLIVDMRENREEELTNNVMAVLMVTKVSDLLKWCKHKFP
jgi:hypothetical protein